MANKKKKKKASNSYWMKYGGNPTKMDKFRGFIEKKHSGGEAGFPHPHPHPKNATELELLGAHAWQTSHNEGKRIKKSEIHKYNWGIQDEAVEAFANSNWFLHYPDTIADAPKTVEAMNAYTDAIDAERQKVIKLHSTDFSWDDFLYGTGFAANKLGKRLMAAPNPYVKAGGALSYLLGWGLTGGKGYYDFDKRAMNEKLKLENPYATFVNEDGEIVNYEDGEGMFFDLIEFKNIRPKPPKQNSEEDPDANYKTPIDYGMGGMVPYKKYGYGGYNEYGYGGTRKKKKEYGHGGYHVSSQKNITEDPTFKMWFAKNARRSDVMQSSSDPQALKQLFLSDINFPGNEMPLFSGEIDGYGNVDKSGRSPELSSKIIGGMQMYGGTPHKRPKAELGMAEGLYTSPTDNLNDYSNVTEVQQDKHGNWQQGVGKVGDTNFLKYLNYAVPGLGTILDIAADTIGYHGDKKNYKEVVKAKNTAKNKLNTVLRGENKDTLDLSTRTDALTALSGMSPEAPSFEKDLLPEIGSNVLSFASSAIGGDTFLGDFMGGKATDSPIDFNNIGADDLPGLDQYAKYGGMPGLHQMGKGGRPGLWANIHAKRARGERPARPGEKGYPKTLDIKAMGGANDFQPGATAAMISGLFNPMSPEHQLQAMGNPGQSYNTGGDPNANVEYEAEGGETIMHAPGQPPATTGDLTPIDEGPNNANDAMLSMLDGNSHQTMDPDGHTGEIVSGEGQQYVFSDKLRSKQWGMTFAEASEKIGKHIAKFKEEMENGDEITKSTAGSMIEAWNQKLMDLQTEQEQARQQKFIDMMESGASQEELQEKFPDIFQQYMQQQQSQQLSESAMQAIAGPTGGMADNPMGNIDMSQLSAQDQQLVGAMYGLPEYDNGGFTPFDFNQYISGLGQDMFSGQAFTLDKDYMPDRRELMDFLTANYPDGGFEMGDDTFTNAKDYYKALVSGFGDWRSGQLESGDIPTSKPKAIDYKELQTIPNEFFESAELTPNEPEFDEVYDWTPGGKAEFTKDKAAYNLFNMGLGVGWDENFGLDNNMSKRQYFKALEQSLLADGKSAEDVASIINREKIKYDENLTNLESIEENKELTPEDKAKLLAKQMRNKKIQEMLSQGFKNLSGEFGKLGPTMYNFAKGREEAEEEQFISNPNEDQIMSNIQRLTNLDIDSLLSENEQNFNMLKYLGKDVAGGNAGSYLNTLIRGQNIQNQADLKAFLTKFNSDQQGLKIANESLYSLGERDRAEGARVSEVNAMNRAAKEAFTAKGWEGLSGNTQLKTLMKNQMAQDESLKEMLNMIYPDAQLYLNRDGTIDIDALEKSGDLQKLIESNPQLKEYLEKYFKK